MFEFFAYLKVGAYANIVCLMNDRIIALDQGKHKEIMDIIMAKKTVLLDVIELWLNNEEIVRLIK